MKNISFKINKNNIKSNKLIYEDPYLNSLASLFSIPSNLKLLRFIKDLFYKNNMEKIRKLKHLGKRRFPNKSDEIDLIFECFESWEYKILNNEFSNYRGIFVEILLGNYLQKTFPENKLHYETKVLTNNFESYTVDYILELDYLYFFETKTAAFSIREKDIINLLEIKNNISHSVIYLVVFDYKTKIDKRLRTLNENPNIGNTIIFDGINLITFEDFESGKPI